MKILGIAENGKYICIVTHHEIEKFLNLFYGNVEKLKTGDEVNLGKGYDYSREMRDALKKTEDFIKSQESVMKAITTGISICNKSDEEINGKLTS